MKNRRNIRIIIAAVFAAALLLPIGASAQGMRAYQSNPATKLRLAAPVTKPATSKVKGAKAKNEAMDKPAEPEYKLYRDVVRRYTWLEGLGEPIDLATAQHLPVYYRLSMKNDAGHWQHIEAMHGDSLTSNHTVDMYGLISKKTEEPTEWELRLDAIAQWLITPTLDGKEVVEERAYDSDGNMIYSFQPIKNRDGRVTCSYNDSWGYPVDFEESDVNYYGSVICIRYDENGYDEVVDYLDGYGLRKRNTDGVDQIVTKRDASGRKIQETSHNIVGDYIHDRWGNCGNRWEYTDSTTTITRLNKYMHPMRMPEDVADCTRTFISCRTTYDKWGRKAQEEMLNEDGERDATSAGISIIRYTYDDNGNLTATTYLDIDDNIMERPL